MDLGLGEFACQALAVAALKVREDHELFALGIAPVDRTGCRKGGEIDVSCGRLGRRFVAARLRLAPGARCTGGKQVGIKFEQASSGHVAPLFHVVEPADEQVARGLIDVEQRVARNDFAPWSELIAADRIDRGLGQPQLQRLRDIACQRGSRCGHGGDSRDPEREDGSGT